ncbi:hypothetical protein JTB14_038430 [Gonioctena quinquepunctata]|nr:hypothetical protein JTB14_038430 [Gonioctena quinquepunctata]
MVLEAFTSLAKMQLEPPMSPINQLKMQHSPTVSPIKQNMQPEPSMSSIKQPKMQLEPPVSPIKQPSSIFLQPKKLFDDDQQLQNDFFVLDIEGIERITARIPNLLSKDNSIGDDVYRPISGLIRPITGLISPPPLMKKIVVAPRNSPPILVRIGTSIPLDGEAGIVQPAFTQLDITQPATTQPTINQPKQ